MSHRTWFGIVGVALVMGLLLLDPSFAQKRDEDPEPPGGRFRNSIGMKFVGIKKGKFTMGSPSGEKDREDNEKEHEVEITKDFYMGVHEVTQKQFKDVMGFNPSYFSKDGKGDEGEYNYAQPAGGKDKVAGMKMDEFPVENVNWQDAQAFLKKLNALAAEKKNGVLYRLPTEVEWEYTCRGGARSSRKPFHFKSPSDSLSSKQANFDGNEPYGGAAKGDYRERTCKVGSYEANALGIYDMHGNVWEWCQDWYDKGYYANSPKTDPPGPLNVGSDRVFRGGSWGSRGRICRAAFRDWQTPAFRSRYVGFRVALVHSK